MAEQKKVRVCKKCSGFNVDDLKGVVKAKDLSTGCISKCLKKNPQLEGKVFGFLNGEFTVCDNKEAFFEKVKSVV